MRLALTIFSIFLYCSPLLAADVDADLKPLSAHVGDTLQLKIHVTGAGSRPVLYPLPADSAFAILRVDSSQVAQGQIGYTLAVYDTGSHLLNEMPVVVGRGAAAETLRTPPFVVAIQSILPDSAQNIQPIKPYRKHPFQWRELIAWSWIPAALLLAAAGWWLWRRHRRKHVPGLAPAKPALPPHEEAVRDLIALRDKKYHARGMMKEFFIEYSYIMRRYLERRYEFPALEMTTFDLDRELERDGYESALCERLLPALRESDLVKFAKFIPDPNRCEGILNLGFEIVDLTRERPQTATAEDKAA